ncbi:nonselective cation channel [Purpureocillium lavendulum]|uniref:Nonselective cation channel n=1 Tax=Purpureocillium lavendulum TaxID=1247861 RepID=A0AB34FXP4_9HYPO|nr:nonselective cation channel [Purpureocillium lavendulum]
MDALLLHLASNPELAGPLLQIVQQHREALTAAASSPESQEQLQSSVQLLLQQTQTPTQTPTLAPLGQHDTAAGTAIASQDASGSATTGPLEQGGPFAAAAATPSSLQQQIPPPPESPEYPSINALMAGLNAFFAPRGAAVVKKSASNYRTVDGVRQPTYYSVTCDRGPRRASSSKGLRRATTLKLDCPFRIVAAANKAADFRWTYRVVEPNHNHGPSSGPEAHAAHRKRTPAQRELMAKLASYGTIKAKDAAEIVKAAGGPAFFRQRDVYNDRQKARKAAGLPPRGKGAGKTTDNSQLDPTSQPT